MMLKKVVCCFNVEMMLKKVVCCFNVEMTLKRLCVVSTFK